MSTIRSGTTQLQYVLPVLKSCRGRNFCKGGRSKISILNRYIKINVKNAHVFCWDKK